jgi:hypothetical protein
MKLISRLLRHSCCLVTSLLLCATSTFAITLTTTNDVRVLADGGANNNYLSNTELSLYNNGSNVQRAHFRFIDLTAESALRSGTGGGHSLLWRSRDDSRESSTTSSISARNFL